MAKKEVITPAGFRASRNPTVTRHQRGYRLRLRQVGRHPTTGQMGSDIREQTRNCLERIKAILEAAGTSLGNVVSATCWLSSRENFAAFNEVYASYFPTDKPVRATVEANLMAQGALVEIMVTACILTSATSDRRLSQMVTTRLVSRQCLALRMRGWQASLSPPPLPRPRVGREMG